MFTDTPRSNSPNLVVEDASVEGKGALGSVTEALYIKNAHSGLEEFLMGTM
jgi:hypothetical protein